MSTVTTNTQTLNLPDPNTLRVVPRMQGGIRTYTVEQKPDTTSIGPTTNIPGPTPQPAKPAIEPISKQPPTIPPAQPATPPTETPKPSEPTLPPAPAIPGQKAQYGYRPPEALETSLKLRTEEYPASPIELIPELKQFKDQLLDIKNPTSQEFTQKAETYKNVADLLFKKKDMDTLKVTHPNVYSAIEWAKAVRQGLINPAANPEVSKQHIKTLWEIGAYNYATKGFQVLPVDPTTRQYVVSRYLDVFNKALGDKKLDWDDMDIVYNNFSKVMGMNPSSPVAASAFQEWWSSENINPLYKAGLLLGVPLTIVGLISGLWKGFSTGNVLLTLLGGAGAALGLGSLMGYQPQGQLQSGIGYSISQLIPQQEPKPVQQQQPISQQPVAAQPVATRPVAAQLRPPEKIKTNVAGLNDLFSRYMNNPQVQDAKIIQDNLKEVKNLINTVRKFEPELEQPRGFLGTVGSWVGITGSSVMENQLQGMEREIDNALYAESHEELMPAVSNLRETINKLHNGILLLAKRFYPSNTVADQSMVAAIRAAVMNLSIPELTQLFQNSNNLQEAMANLAARGKRYARTIE